MFKLLLLDFNVIGIITSFISDNFEFLHFLKQNEVKPYYKEINWNTVNWEEVSNNIEKYDLEIIEEFKEHFDWNLITSKKMDDQQFLTKYSELVNFEIINQKMRFSYSIEYNFYETFEDKFDWIRLSRWADMAEDFIDKFHDKLDWGVLCRAQGLTEYIMNKYYNKLILEDLRYNYHIERAIKDEIINRLTNDRNPPQDENEEAEEDEDIDIQNNDERDLLEESDFDISDNIPREDMDIENNEEENIQNLI